MIRFNILQKDLNIHCNKLLEASAGTGKTFSIENLVVRLLLEGTDPLTIDKILIVTFTRMATRDLKMRVRENIERAIRLLEAKDPQNFEYLYPFLESEGQSLMATRRLEQALLGFDEAQIFTIHGFCSRMLSECGFEGNLKVDVGEMDQGIGRERLLQCVHDFFRTGISEREVGPAHLDWALKHARGSLEKLEGILLRVLAGGVDVSPTPSYTDLCESFTHKMQLLKGQYGVNAEKIRHDFEYLSSFYNGVSDKSNRVKPEVIELIERFAGLFQKEQWTKEDYDQLVKDKLFYSDTFVPEKRKKRGKPPAIEALHLPELVSLLKEHLQPIVQPNLGIGRMAAGCQKLMRHQLMQEELMGYDDLLVSMQEGLSSSVFVQKIRDRYRAVVVDEFQDTDPRQWEIFKQLFPPDKKGWGHLYLVGDPKQSIYAFRQADIYTYLEAAAMIGKNNTASLDTNYRSQPMLVSALNYLFTANFTKGWMPLPKNETFLEVPQVKWSANAVERDFNDQRGAVHFFIKESDKLNIEDFFPFIVQEIQRLHCEERVPLREFSILVSDRYQAKEIASYLKEWGIASVRQRTESLTKSIVVIALKELLYAIYYYRDESAVKTALGGHFIRWTHDRVRELDNNEIYESVQGKLQTLLGIWKQEGLAACLQTLLNLSWNGGKSSVLENILRQEEGEVFFSDYQQLMHLLLEQEQGEEAVIEFLEELTTKDEEEDPKLKRKSDPNQDAVQILTLHASKGLEFGVVFALGLLKRPKQTELFFPSKKSLKLLTNRQEEDYQEYVQELDAEKMRQLYVAMTRAKYRLYCPAAITSGDVHQSPMDIFLSFFNTDLMSYLDQAKEQESIAYTILNEDPIVLKRLDERSDIQMIEPKQVTIPGSPVYIQSFSSLSHKKSHPVSDEDPPHDFNSELKAPHTLPSGSETGTLLHRLLEEIPFYYGKQWKSPDDAIPFVLPYIEDTDYQPWKAVLAEIVYHAAKAPLVDGVALEDIDPSCLDYESEFLFSKGTEGYIKGFIDLTFYHAGKYYLLDWKSNWLGHYSQQRLDQSMKEHDYYLQAEIYTNALSRYLSLIEDKPFEEIFGGVFYVFLRGLPEHGIIHFKPAICTD